jgi:hypothetical protein
VAAGALRHGDDSVDIRLQRLDRMPDGRRVMKDETAVGMDCIDNLAGDA